ncbi:hypothetical protein N9V58_02670 [Candidatus Poseidoniales archaeon]|nr:hypothetical protein [Candidatus Poseidoniales archaeon]
MRVLHVLANSPPDVNGYAVRTHGLMKAYAELPNVEVVGLTSPWYPEKDSMAEPIEIDEIVYHRCLHPARMESIKGSGLKWTASRGKNRIAGSEGFASKPIWKRAASLAFKPLRPGWAWIEERILFKHFTKKIIEVAKSEKADIIHAHVPYKGIRTSICLRNARNVGGVCSSKWPLESRRISAQKIPKNGD